MTKPHEKSKVVRKLRCAVYTRKSSEEGLEQEFNSLHAQREACEAFIASQRSEGWVLVRDQVEEREGLRLAIAHPPALPSAHEHPSRLVLLWPALRHLPR